MITIFSAIIDMSLTASFVILAVMAIRLFLMRVPRIFSYLLWLAVLIRLICPVLPQAGFGIAVTGNLTWEELRQQIKELKGDIVYLPEETVTVTETGTESIYIYNDEVKEPVIVDHTDTAAQPGTDSNTEGSMGSADRVLSVIWFIMLTGLILYESFSYLFFMRRIRQEKARETEEYGKIIVKAFSAVRTPFTAGFLHPVIYLPAEMDEEQRRLVIEHEKIHIRRFDHVIKPFAFLLCCVYWFNPLVWAAFCLMERDMEASCDEAVLKRIGYDRRKDYAGALLNLAGKENRKAGYPIAFGENGVKSRIKNVVNVKKTGKAATVLSAVFVAAVIIIFSVDHAEGAEIQENVDGESIFDGMKALEQSENYIPDEKAYSGKAAVPEGTDAFVIPETDSGETTEYVYKSVESGRDTIANYDPARDQFEVILLTDTGVHNDVRILYSYPVEYTEISASFGARVNVLTQEEKLHSGIDFAADTGTPITAAADGVVVKTGTDAECGRYIILQHVNGDMTYYACCDEILAEEGRTVARGEQIATVGSTGTSTGAHLHFAVSRGGSYIEPEFQEETAAEE